ncbi:MAG: hypothetical protein Kow0068_19670 [Marinilabiliales bacterium]
MLKENTKVFSFHILIFERQTEEESVLTISKLLSIAGFKVSVFISSHIASLISEELDKNQIIYYILPDNLQLSLKNVSTFIEKKKVNLVIFTRYSANTFAEHKLYKQFVRKHKVCSLIESYDRWFRKFPPIKLNGPKIIKRSLLLSWVFCKNIFDDFACYFISDIHPNSTNPFKKLIREKNQKPILDFPFKIMEQKYKPNINYKKPVFVIPGAVSAERRNYYQVLNIFSQKEIQEKDWELILLGRPIGQKGKQILKKAKQINIQYGNNKIIVFEEYIPKKQFDEFMNKSTHIIAPIKPKAYKYGKDSGALYDILKYNKIGIINKEYFYSDNLPEIELMHTYSTNKELYKIVYNIICKRAKEQEIAFNKMNELFSIQNYKINIKNMLSNLFVKFNLL